jgi:hypothetical protein
VSDMTEDERQAMDRILGQQPYMLEYGPGKWGARGAGVSGSPMFGTAEEAFAHVSEIARRRGDTNVIASAHGGKPAFLAAGDLAQLAEYLADPS